MKRLILVGLAAMSVTVPATGRCQPPVLLQTLDHYGPHGFARPWGISHDAAGNFYVLDYVWLRVFAFTSSGDTLRSWPVPFRSMYMAVGGDGLAYLTAPYPDGTCLTPVLVYTLDGALVSIWDGSGSGPGQFIHPEGVAVDEAGRVYVSEQGNARVQVLTADGQPVTQWGSRGTAPGQFSDPEGLALGRDGLVYVTDADNETVQVFTRRGDLVRWWGGEFGGDPGQFWGLRGITLDASGNVYIADTGERPHPGLHRHGRLPHRMGHTRLRSRAVRPPHVGRDPLGWPHLRRGHMEWPRPGVRARAHRGGNHLLGAREDSVPEVRRAGGATAQARGHRSAAGARRRRRRVPPARCEV